MKVLCISITLAIAGFAVTAQAADQAAGHAKAEALCAACHTVNGNPSATQYPILAGQYEDYLRKALRDFRSGARSNAIMNGNAKNLSDADIDNLAAWYASQPATPLTTKR